MSRLLITNENLDNNYEKEGLKKQETDPLFKKQSQLIETRQAKTSYIVLSPNSVS